MIFQTPSSGVIRAGASKVYEDISNAVYFNGPENKSVTVNFTTVTPPTQAYNYQWISNGTAVDNELYLRTFTNTRTCFATSQNMGLAIYSNSCEVIPQSTPFSINYYNPATDQRWSKDYMMSAPLTNRNSIRVNETVSVNPNELTSIEVELVFENDPDNSNNSSTYRYNPIRPIVKRYYQDFTTLKSDTLVRLSGFAQAGLKNVSGEDLFAVTANSTIPFNNLLCETPEETMGGFYDLTYVTCLDLESMDDPVMRFDLGQYRNEDATEFPELGMNTAILSVTIDDGSECEVIYYNGLQEGVIEKFEHTLDPNFKGSVLFDFFTYTGNFNSADFLNYDVILMDNLEIVHGVVSTIDLDQSPLVIRPNPSLGYFGLEHHTDPVSITVSDLTGKQIMFKQGSADLDHIDLGGQANGYYTLLVHYTDGSQRVASLLKMD